MASLGETFITKSYVKGKKMSMYGPSQPRKKSNTSGRNKRVPASSVGKIANRPNVAAKRKPLTKKGMNPQQAMLARQKFKPGMR